MVSTPAALNAASKRAGARLSEFTISNVTTVEALVTTFHRDKAGRVTFGGISVHPCLDCTRKEVTTGST